MDRTEIRALCQAMKMKNAAAAPDPISRYLRPSGL